jgi:hypothetical protein
MAFSTDNIGKNCYINISEDENIEDSLYGTIIGYYKDTDKNEEYYFVSINGNVKRIYDDSLVNIIEDGGGGSGAVSSVNGQTGTVVLDAEDVGAEPKKFVITVTYDDGNDEYTADKTFSEIQAAYEAGKILFAKNDIFFYNLSLFEYEDNATFVTFGYDEGVLGKITFVELLRINSDDSVDYAYIESPSIPTTVTVSGSTPTVTPVINTIYQCGKVASLTISNPPANGAYSIVFTSGSTATTTTFPATILGLEDFAAEANTLYEINVLDNRAVVGSWAVSA